LAYGGEWRGAGGGVGGVWGYEGWVVSYGGRESVVRGEVGWVGLRGWGVWERVLRGGVVRVGWGVGEW